MENITRLALLAPAMVAVAVPEPVSSALGSIVATKIVYDMVRGNDSKQAKKSRKRKGK